jgi:hypothetical protein
MRCQGHNRGIGGSRQPIASGGNGSAACPSICKAMTITWSSITAAARKSDSPLGRRQPRPERGPRGRKASTALAAHDRGRLGRMRTVALDLFGAALTMRIFTASEFSVAGQARGDPPRECGSAPLHRSLRFPGAGRPRPPANERKPIVVERVEYSSRPAFTEENFSVGQTVRHSDQP